jgi:hypothetical protein
LESRAFAYEARASTRPAVLQVVERLTAEFAGVHSVGEVIAEAYRAARRSLPTAYERVSSTPLKRPPESD